MGWEVGLNRLLIRIETYFETMVERLTTMEAQNYLLEELILTVVCSEQTLNTDNCLG